MFGRLELQDDFKEQAEGGARRRNNIRMTSATSKQPQSLIGWPQRSMVFRKTFSELSTE